MSSVDREAPPVQVIREHPPLMAELVRQAGVGLPEQVEVDLDAEGAAVLRSDADILPLTAITRPAERQSDIADRIIEQYPAGTARS